MIAGAGLAYAQARMQAHLGARPSASAWDALLAMVEYRPFLEQARATALRRWLPAIGHSSSLHEIERALRAAWRARVVEVAAWTPQRWRPATRWLAHASDLPPLDHLLAGGAAASWMLGDEVLGAVALSDPGARNAVLAQGSLAELAPRPGERRSLVERWAEAWTARMPRASRACRARLDRLRRTLREHRHALLSQAAPSGADPRRRLERALLYQFRRALLDPAAVFQFVILEAIEVERLRGALVARRAVAPDAS